MKQMFKNLRDLWPGNNRFCCNKFITGPRSIYATIFPFYVLEIAVLTPYFILAAPRVWNDQTHTFPILVVVFSLLSILLFHLTSFMDPGIVPRRAFLAHSPEISNKFLLPNIVGQNGTDKREFCATCQIYVPCGGKHCDICNNCVERFCHHCYLLNNCIGKRNSKFFLGFLVSLLLSYVYILVSLIILLFSTVIDNGGTIACIVCAAFVGGAVLSLAVYSIYQCVLARRILFISKQVGEGWTQRFQTQMQQCPITPSLLDFDKQYDFGSQILIGKSLTEQSY